MTLATSLPHSPGRVPLWLKLAYTAFMAILVPVYLYYYGPTNFLYFCDVALFLGLALVLSILIVRQSNERGRSLQQELEKKAAAPMAAPNFGAPTSPPFTPVSPHVLRRTQ